MFRFLAAWIVLVPLVVPLPAQTVRRYQTSFGVETQINRRHRVPKYVVKLIQTDLNHPVRDDLQGSFVNLDDDNTPELLVQGDSGANIGGFWLFRKSHGRWKQVYYAVGAWFFISSRRSKGLRNVSIAAASEVKLWEADYRFNGHRYIPFRCSVKDLGIKMSKKIYFPCGRDAAKPYR